jgi:predicted acylesterase/phospholipase RssA
MIRPIALVQSQPWFVGSAHQPISSCFGSGGAFGIGFDMGVVTALIDSGIPVDKGPMLGTSAGAWTAASVAAGLTWDELLDIPEGFERTDEPVRVIELTSSLFGDLHDARVTGMAIQLPFGRRTALSGEDHALADVVAASSSPPKFAHPHKIGGRRYIDAGITRCTSVDRAESAHVLVVVTPMTGRVVGPFGRVCEGITRFEIEQWRIRTAGDVLFIRPNAHIASFVADGGIDALLDVEAGRRVFEPAYELGLQCAEEFLESHPKEAEEFELLRSAPAT